MIAKRRRWLRWLRWLGVIVICWITVVPTLETLWMRHRVVSAVRSAKSVRLEEFHLGRVITKVELEGEGRKAVISALPIVPDIGLPGMIALCFFPHHRVVITTVEDHEVTFDVCFGCEEVRFHRGAIMMTPYLWHSSLRRLFSGHKIPIRENREYRKFEKPHLDF